MSNKMFSISAMNRLIVSSPWMVIVVAIAATAPGCAGLFNSPAAVNYLYAYTLTQPEKNGQLVFRDDYIVIQFKIDPSAVSFQLQNVSETSLSIVWNKVSLGVNKRIFDVRSSGTLYSGANAAPAQVSIPPLGYIREMVIPRENIYADKSGWVEKELFRSNDKGSPALKKAIISSVGSELSLSLPLKIGEFIKEYNFIFTVNKITALPPSLLPPVKDRPAPPKITQQESAAKGSIIPIVISAGILGVAVYFFAHSKTSTPEL